MIISGALNVISRKLSPPFGYFCLTSYTPPSPKSIIDLGRAILFMLFPVPLAIVAIIVMVCYNVVKSISPDKTHETTNSV